MRDSGKLPGRSGFRPDENQPVDKVLNNFFTDWGQARKLSKAEKLSKKYSGAIQALPSVYTFRKRLIFFR